MQSRQVLLQRQTPSSLEPTGIRHAFNNVHLGSTPSLNAQVPSTVLGDNPFGLKRSKSSKSGFQMIKKEQKQPHRSSSALVRKHSASSDSSARKSSSSLGKKNSFNKIVSDTCLLMQKGSFKTITSSLPHHLNEVQKNETWENTTKPLEVLMASLKELGHDATVKDAATLPDYFVEFTEEHMAGYDQDIIQAIRGQDIETLRKYHAAGRTLQCCNRFGESLIHMACRRGFNDVASFLMNEAGVSIKVKDDYGRTPMHDACWAVTPNFELMNMLLDKEPEMILIRDKRGHTPLDYVRRNHWDLWVNYLLRRYKKGSSQYKQ